MTKTILVTSGKGGTGKTSLCAGVGTALALMDKSCLLVDADAGLRSLDLTLGIHETAVFDFFDVSLGRIEIQDACVQPISGLSVLNAPSFSVSEGLPEDALTKAVEIAKSAQRYDYILIDCPAGLGVGFHAAAACADSAIVVSGTDRVSLRCADKTAQILGQHGILEAYLVVNRVRKKLLRSEGALNIDDAMDLSGLPLLGYVPDDDMVYKSLLAGIPLLVYGKNTSYSAVRAYLNIARRITGESVRLMKK